MKKLVVGLLLLVLPVCSWAASLQYVKPGTPLTFADSGQSGVVASTTLTLSGLGTGAGQYSARYDKGAGAQPAWWGWACHIQLTGTNVPGTTVEVYIGWSDGTNADAGLGTTTAALATDKRRNLKLVGLLIADQATTNTTMYASSLAYIPTRYFSVALWNASGLPLKTDTAVHACVLTPLPTEMQ